MKVTVDGQPYQVEVAAGVITVDGEPHPVRVRAEDDVYLVQVDGTSWRVRVPLGSGNPLTVQVEGREHQVSLERPLGLAWPGGGRPWRPAPPAGLAVIAAQLRGRVVTVRVQPGAAVAEGQLLLTVEAMKMENEIRAPKAGTVVEVAVQAGDLVSEGDVLVVVE